MIEKIESMARPELIKLDDRPYTTRPVFPVLEPKISPLEINTLTGIMDYLNFEPDIKVVENTDVFILIKSANSVSIMTNLYGQFSERQTILKATFQPKPFGFGQWYDLESFIIAVQAFFIQDETTAAMLKITGNLASGTTVEHTDDGITQQVKAKTGIARIENICLPNPVTLKPYRTFLEIDQPTGLFVFRMRQNKDHQIECAIFEADCGLWQLAAIDFIYNWLRLNANANITIIR
jgi:hypothetical protein